MVLVYRGSFEPILVPFDVFRPAGNGLVPNFDDFAITDSGQTLRLGEYEAAVDVVLYDRDPQYRKRAKALEIERDTSFGGALKRLRLLRGLAQTDFAPISEREVRRIESNDVTTLHPRNRKVIAERLGVPFSEIGSY